MQRPVTDRLSAVQWSDYETAYGNAAGDHMFESGTGTRRTTERWGSVAEQLVQLSSTDVEQALAASHHLWCCLCHQHAYVASAALPALPFLLLALDDANELLAIEILDILAGMAICSRAGGAKPDGPWIVDLRRQLVAERSRFEALVTHPNQEVSDWAQTILAELAA
jgi:hypothetical protein